MLYVNRGGGKRERRKVDLHSNFFKHLINKTAITPQKGYFAIKLKQPHGPFQTKKKLVKTFSTSMAGCQQLLCYFSCFEEIFS
jgi:hypothetical protein